MTEAQVMAYCKSIGFPSHEFTKTMKGSWFGDSQQATVTDWEAIGRLIDVLYRVPRDYDMIRCSGDLVCDMCGKKYYQHPDNLYYLDQNDEPYLKDSCYGRLLKL